MGVVTTVDGYPTTKDGCGHPMWVRSQQLIDITLLKCYFKVGVVTTVDHTKSAILG